MKNPVQACCVQSAYYLSKRKNRYDGKGKFDSVDNSLPWHATEYHVKHTHVGIPYICQLPIISFFD